MELTIALAITILNCVLGVVTFFLNRKKEAIQNTKENHQELIEYQLKELKDGYKEVLNEIKGIKALFIDYKDDVRKIVKDEIDEHIRLYHSGNGEK